MYKDRKRKVWLEINLDIMFDSLAELINYYKKHEINEEFPFKLKTPVDKHTISKNETWYVEATDEEIQARVRSHKRRGLFFIRNSTGNTYLVNGLMHLFTMVIYLNKTSLEFQKFAICKHEESGSLWIMSQEFSSLIELVHYFKSSIISNDLN